MKMFIKLLFIGIISSTRAELLDSLCGLKVRMTACSVKGVHCEGALVLTDYVVVRDSCIRDQYIEHIYVQKGVVNCTQESTTPAIGPARDSSVRSVVARYSHPQAPDVNLSLLKLDWPYPDKLDNRTISDNAQKILEIWIEHILYPTENTKWDQTESYTQRQYRMYSSPIKMFFVTVILPSASFIVFFLFVVFYTGNSDTSKIPYKTFSNDNKSSHV